MTTIAFSVDDTRVVKLGVISPFNQYRQFTGIDSEIRMAVTGTDFSLTYSAQEAGILSVTVDGVTTTPALALGADTSLDVFTGLADEAHSVVVRSHGWGTFFVLPFSLTLTGASPAIAPPSDSVFSGRAVVHDDEAATTPKLSLGGISEDQANAGYNYRQNSYSGGLYGGGSIRFRAACSQIDLWCYVGAGNNWRVYRDSAVWSAPVVASDGSRSYGRAAVATGLDPSQAHEYEVVFDDASNYHELFEVLLTGGTGFDATHPPAARGVFAVMGDSIAAGAFGPASECYAARMARSRGLALANAGVSSSTVGPANSPMPSRTGAVTQFGASVSEVVVCGGINDILVGVSVPAYQAAYLAMIQSFLAGCPSAKVWCLGILPCAPSVTTQATVAAYNAAAQASVADAGSARVKFIDPTGWTDALAPGGDYTVNYVSDGLHPNGLGHAIIQARLEAAAGAYAGTYPAPADVRLSVGYGPGGADMTGALAVPTPAQVLLGAAVDSGAGTVALPAAGQVLSGVTFGPGSGTAGTVALPAADQVEGGVTFGPGSGTTGTAPTPADVAAAVWTYGDRTLTS